MKKFITPTYTFTPGASGVGTVNLSGITGFNVKNLVAIINQTAGVVIYSTGSQTLKYTNVTGTTVTLFFDTTGMSSGDTLQVIYEDNSAITVEPILIDKDGNEVPAKATASGAAAIGNTLGKFRDNFVLGSPDTNIWDQQYVNQGTTFVTRGGEANGSSYLKISMCPFTAGSEYILTSKEVFKAPFNLGFGISESQRFIGQEFIVGLAGVDSNNNVQYITTKPDVALPATISIVNPTGTITFATPHSFKSGDRVVLIGNSDNRINIGPITLTVVTEFSVTFATTLASATYNTNGFIRYADPADNLFNAAVLNNGEASAQTTMNAVSRRNGASFRSSSLTISTNAATVVGSSNFSELFNASNNLEIVPTNDDVVFTSRAADSTASPGTPIRYSQGNPSDDVNYKVFIRAFNNDRLPRPVARIVSISKTASVTCTVTTDVPHGLTTNSRITIYGVRDATNFPTLSSPTQVSSIISPTQFTIGLGGIATATSAGGRVDLCEGNQTITGGNTNPVQSISRTNNLINITTTTTVSGITQGETIHLYGCDATSMGLYDGAYLVRRLIGSSIIVESVGPNFATINCGGSILKRTDFRIHSIRVNDYARTVVELSSNTSTDAQRALPVAQQGTISASISGTPTVIISGGVVTNVAPSTNFTAVLSFVVNSSTVSSSNTRTSPSSFFIVSTSAVSGTNPTLDIMMQESIDGGITWRDSYQFPRITSVTSFQLPIMSNLGSAYRFNYTVGGTSPSFTLSITECRTNLVDVETPKVIYDRTLAINTLNSTSLNLANMNTRNIQLVASVGAATTPPTLQLEGTVDNGASWFPIGSPLVTVASSVVQTTVASMNADSYRARVSSAGSGATLNYIQLRAF